MKIKNVIIQFLSQFCRIQSLRSEVEEEMHCDDIIRHSPHPDDDMEMVEGSVGLCWRPKAKKS